MALPGDSRGADCKSNGNNSKKTDNNGNTPQKDCSSQKSSTKTPGANNATGTDFEVMMLTLVYLRLLDSGLEFSLDSNIASAGKFDDIVVNYRAVSEQSWNTALLQLKHKQNGNLPDTELLGFKKDFSLVMYCDSYFKLKSSKKKDTKFYGDFDSHQFNIFTNAKCRDALITKGAADPLFDTGGEAVFFATEPDSQVFKRLCEWVNLKLKVTQLKDKIKGESTDFIESKIKEAFPKPFKYENKAVNSTIQSLLSDPKANTVEKTLESLELVPNNTESFVEFLGKLRLYTGQAHSEKLGEIIKNCVENTLKLTDRSESSRIASELTEKVKAWWKKSNKNLTQDSRMWLDIVKTHIDKLTTKRVGERTERSIQFTDTSVDALHSKIPWTTSGVLHVIVDSRTTASAMKTVAALARFGEEERILHVDLATLLDREDEIVGAWSSSWCRALVLECDTEVGKTDAARLSGKVIQVVKGEVPGKLFVFVGRKKNGLTETMDNIKGYKYYMDSCMWDILTPASQEKLLGVEVELQGSKNSLQSLTDGKENFTEQVNEDVISQLLLGDTRCGKELETDVHIFVPRRLKTSQGGPFTVDSASDVPNKVVLVVAGPGMGKSTLIRHLALSVKKEDSKEWIINITLNDCTKHLAAMTVESFNDNAAKKMLENILLDPDNSLEIALFRSFDRNFIVAIDGVDEVCPHYEKQALTFLRHLASLEMKQLWVTSRPTMQHKLETDLKVRACMLEPFSQTDQYMYFQKAWKVAFPEANEEKLKDFTDKLTEVLQTRLGRFEPIWEVPLMASMVAQVFEEDLRSFLDGGEQEKSIKLDTLYLYETFMKKKFDLYYTEKKKIDGEARQLASHSDDEEKLKKIFLLNHRLAAIRFLFNPRQMTTLRLQGYSQFESILAEFLEEVRSGREKRGIIDNVSADGIPHFVHNTFAEYFVASWLSENFKDNKEFVKLITADSAFAWTSDMFNRILARDHLLHTAVLNREMEKVKRLLEDEGVNCESQDAGGRTPVHLAVLLSSTKDSLDILPLLLQHNARVDVADNVLGWRPLQYADNAHAWTLAGVLLSRGGSEDDMFTVKPIKQPTRRAFIRFVTQTPTAAPEASLMLAAARDADLSVVRILVEEFRGDVHCRGPRGETMMHMAAKGGDVALLEYLYAKGLDLHAEDLNHKRPMNYAALQDHTDAVSFFLENTDDPGLLAQYQEVAKPKTVTTSSPANLTAGQTLHTRYRKRGGVADGAGESYECKMLTLVFLRMLASANEFQLASNMEAAGPFDDIVMRYRKQFSDLGRTFCVQSQHKHSKVKVIPKKEFLNVIGGFSLVKYCASFASIKSLVSKELQSPDEPLVVLYTNAKIPPDLVDEVESDELLCTGGKVVSFKPGGEVYRELCEWVDFKETLVMLNIDLAGLSDEEVGNRIQVAFKSIEYKNKAVTSWKNELLKTPTLRKVKELLKRLEPVSEKATYSLFLAELQVYTGQAHESELDAKIKEELRKVWRSGNDLESKNMFNELLGRVQSWWKKGNYYLTQDSLLWLDIIKSQAGIFSKDTIGGLTETTVEFDERSLQDLHDKIGNSGGICHLRVDKRTAASSLRVHQALTRFGARDLNVLHVNMKALLAREDDVLSAWATRWCPVLVVECDDELNRKQATRVCEKILKVVGRKHEAKQLVLISRIGHELNEQLYRSESYTSINDNGNWNDLTEDTKTNVFYRKIVINGFLSNTNLSDLAGESKRFANKVNLEVISQFISDDYCIGKDLDKEGKYFVTRRLKNCAKDDLFVVNSVHDVPGKVVLVVAEPGMGKSTLFTHLAQSAKKDSSSSWVVQIRLHDCVQLLKGVDVEHFNELAAMTFLEQVTLNSGNSLEKLLFVFLKNKLVVFVDGVDEVCPHYETQVFKLLSALRNMPFTKLYVASRPVFRESLETTLNVKTHLLVAFSVEDQTIFFNKVRKLQNPSATHEEYTNWTQILLSWLTESLGEDNPILGVPLMNAMLVDMFQEREFLETGGKGEFKPRERLDVMSLYRDFVEKKFDLYCVEKRKTQNRDQEANLDIEKKLKEQMHHNHRLAALRVLFSPEEISTLQFEGKERFDKDLATYLKEVSDGTEKIGVIDNVVDGVPHFVHRSFAEYFVASWLASCFKENREFLERVLFDSVYGLMAKMFDWILAGSHPLHLAVLKRDVEAAKGFLTGETPSDVNEQDTGGRTPLHLAVILSGTDQHPDCIRILKLLLQDSKVRLDVPENVFCMVPQQLAEVSRAWEALQILLERNEHNSKKMKSWPKPDPRVMLDAARDAPVSVVRYLVEVRGGKLNCRGPAGEGMVHRAAEREGVEMLEYLSKKLPLDSKDNRGNTAMCYASQKCVSFLHARGLPWRPKVF